MTFRWWFLLPTGEYKTTSHKSYLPILRITTAISLASPDLRDRSTMLGLLVGQSVALPLNDDEWHGLVSRGTETDRDLMLGDHFHSRVINHYFTFQSKKVQHTHFTMTSLSAKEIYTFHPPSNSLLPPLLIRILYSFFTSLCYWIDFTDLFLHSFGQQHHSGTSCKVRKAFQYCSLLIIWYRK